MNEITTPSRLRWVGGVLHQYGLRVVLGQIPRLYYGNDAGMLENYQARRELRRLRNQSDLNAHDARADVLRQEGYLLLGTPYSEALVGQIRDKFQRLVADPTESLDIGPRLKSAIRGIIDPVGRIPEIQELINGELRTILNAYYGAHFRIEHVRAWRNVHVEGPLARQDVYSNLWHNDQDPVTLLRLFVYLSDGVTRETGATRFHSIPVTKKIIRRGYLRRRAILPPARRLLEDETHIRYFEGGVGSACLMNPQMCLHSATVPKRGVHRDMLQLTIAPAGTPLSRTWAEELPKDPVMQMHAAMRM